MMKKFLNLVLLTAMFALPIACGGGLDVPPVTEFPPANPPSNPPSNTPEEVPHDFPEIGRVDPFPEVCHVDDPDCGDDNDHQVGPVQKPEYGKVGDHPKVELADPNLTQINPCLEDPEAEGC